MFDWYRNYTDRQRAEYMEYYLPLLMKWDVVAEQIDYNGKKKWVATVREGGIVHHYAKIKGVMTELTTGMNTNDLRN